MFNSLMLVILKSIVQYLKKSIHSVTNFPAFLQQLVTMNQFTLKASGRY